MNRTTSVSASRVKVNNIRYIAVHSTQSKPGQLPAMRDFHYLITTSGEILRPQKLTGPEGCVSVAYVGGMDEKGRPANTMNYRQQDALYGLLIGLSNQFKKAAIKGANELYLNTVDTGFNLTEWLHEFTPRLSAAA